MSGVIHVPVMTGDIMHYLRPRSTGTYLDCTVGTGGHLAALFEEAGPGIVAIGVDWDTQALAVARKRLAQFGRQCHLVQDNFANIDRILTNLGIEAIDGVIFDLGLSSLQLEDEQRGFSFRTEAPLDMRMNQNNQRTASDIVNNASPAELETILLQYGEERWARRMAQFIVQEREMHGIVSTGQLVDILKRAVPAHFRRGRKYHFATRAFQALRIAVNQELDNLRVALPAATEKLAPGGRMCVLSYHSLEDRIVKHYFKKAEGYELTIQTKRVLRPSTQEVRDNPRSRSAKLRVAEKVHHA